MKGTGRHTTDGSPARRLRWTVALALGIVSAGCGDDEDTASPQRFCDLARDLDQQAQFPSDAQLEDLVAAAPGEIADEVRLLADALVARGETAFGEPAVETALAAIETYEADTCDLEGNDAAADETGSLDDLTPDPDHPYCDVEEQIDATFQDAGASATNQGAAIEDAAQRVLDQGLLEDGRTLVPDDIQDDFETLASAVEDAAAGDPRSITSSTTERAGRRVDYFCGQN